MFWGLRVGGAEYQGLVFVPSLTFVSEATRVEPQIQLHLVLKHRRFGIG
jgi:hypothetical protein